MISDLICCALSQNKGNEETQHASMLHGIRQGSLADNLIMSLIGRLKRRLVKGVAVRASSPQLELRASRVTAPSTVPLGLE